MFEDVYHKRLNKNLLDEYESDEIKLEELKRFIQKSLLSENLNVLIGSGCSVQAIPLMSKTFEDVKKQIDNEYLGEYIEDSNIEGYLNWLINAMNFYSNDEHKNEKYSDAFNKTVKALIDSMPKFDDYHNEFETMIEKKEGAIETLSTYERFYNAIFNIRDNTPISRAPLNIFTTNYDLFNENALDNINVHYSLGFQGGLNRKFNPSMFNLRYVDTENRFKKKWNPVRRFSKIYKLHGSTNWINKGNDIFLTDSNSDDSDSVMIYPSYVKHDITNQSPYSELFREFSLNLQKPNSVLLVIGFGFPDEHINQLIEQALNNEDFILIIFADYEEEKIKRFYDKNSSKNNIHLIGGNFKDNRGKLHYFNNIVYEILKDNIDLTIKAVNSEGISDES